MWTKIVAPRYTLPNLWEEPWEFVGRIWQGRDTFDYDIWRKDGTVLFVFRLEETGRVTSVDYRVEELAKLARHHDTFKDLIEMLQLKNTLIEASIKECLEFLKGV